MQGTICFRKAILKGLWILSGKVVEGVLLTALPITPLSKLGLDARNFNSEIFIFANDPNFSRW